MRINKLLIIALAITLPTVWGCKKFVEEKKEDLLVNLITSNIWVMNSFSEDGTDLTAAFSGYEFKFNKDGSVFGIKAGQPNATGTWAGDATAMTVQSNFPTETGVFKKLNGTFSITSTTLSEVKANRFEGTTEYKLHLKIK